VVHQGGRRALSHAVGGQPPDQGAGGPARRRAVPAPSSRARSYRGGAAVLRRRGAVIGTMRTATERLRTQAGRRRPLAVTTTHSFAALWLIPRLAGFTREHPGVDVRITADTRVLDLERDGLDIAIRHGPAALAGPNATRLFGEKVFPVCSPKLLKKTPLEKPADLKDHVLLQYDDPDV